MKPNDVPDDVPEVYKKVKEIIALMWGNCSNCGEYIYRAFNFCPHCGKKQE